MPFFSHTHNFQLSSRSTILRRYFELHNRENRRLVKTHMTKGKSGETQPPYGTVHDTWRMHMFNNVHTDTDTHMCAHRGTLQKCHGSEHCEFMGKS